MKNNGGNIHFDKETKVNEIIVKSQLAKALKTTIVEFVRGSSYVQ